MDILVDASCHAETDHLRGVSECVILGKLPRLGTGSFDLMLDAEKCKFGMEIPTNIMGPGMMGGPMTGKQQELTSRVLVALPVSFFLAFLVISVSSLLVHSRISPLSLPVSLSVCFSISIHLSTPFYSLMTKSMSGGWFSPCFMLYHQT